MYAIPWFINAEGMYYRTDLMKTPPTTPAQLVSDAQAAVKKDPALKEGLASRAFEYEGAVTACQSSRRLRSASLTQLSNIDTPRNSAGTDIHVRRDLQLQDLSDWR